MKINLKHCDCVILIHVNLFLVSVWSLPAPQSMNLILKSFHISVMTRSLVILLWLPVLNNIHDGLLHIHIISSLHLIITTFSLVLVLVQLLHCIQQFLLIKTLITELGGCNDLFQGQSSVEHHSYRLKKDNKDEGSNKHNSNRFQSEVGVVQCNFVGIFQVLWCYHQ